MDAAPLHFVDIWWSDYGAFRLLRCIALVRPSEATTNRAEGAHLELLAQRASQPTVPPPTGGCGVSGDNQQLWNNFALYEHQRFGRDVRGQAFSRYGGVGNHRTPHGFSGDTFQVRVVGEFSSPR